jgi:predicted HTH transcriptional regulator
VRGNWIEAVPGGYRLAPGVEVSSPFTAARGAAPPPRRQAFASPAPEPDVVLALLARTGPASSSDVASHLGVSEMTALRRLREHVEQGAVSRDGKGKNTRYRLVGSP